MASSLKSPSRSKSTATMIAELAWRLFGFVYGCVNLVLMVAIAGLRDRAFTRRMSQEEKKELDAAQHSYWSLDRQPLPGYTHQFLTLRNGSKLHYVVNRAPSDSPTGGVKNVAIFIHGFPDSFVLWRNLLTAPDLESHILIAVDLPGYGGSDGLSNYGPNEVLDTMTEFILGMRTKYLAKEAKLVVVSHDWGAIVAARLASEAPQLADRFIITSGVIPQHTYFNVIGRVNSAKQMLQTCLRQRNIRLLKNARHPLKPVLSQIGRSFYIFIFQLPHPLSSFFTTFGNYWLLRVLHYVAAGTLTSEGKFVRKLSPKESADFMAMSSGPGLAQLGDNRDGYPDAVRKRVKDRGMSEKIRYYREHLLLNPWEKSLETVIALSEIPQTLSRSGSDAGFLDDGPPGALRAPATIIYGKDDRAFNMILAMDLLPDYLAKSSTALVVDGGGHWLPLESEGGQVIREVVKWALSDEAKPCTDMVDSKHVHVLGEK